MSKDHPTDIISSRTGRRPQDETFLRGSKHIIIVKNISYYSFKGMNIGYKRLGQNHVI